MSTTSAAPDAELGVPASGVVDDRPRSAMERLVRRILLVEGAAPRSLMPMTGSLALSAVRCILSYVLIPILLPVVGWLGPVATPLSLALTLLAVGLAVRSLRRVWLADWSGRWGYTAFAGVVIVVLLALVAVDVRTLLT